MMVGAAIAGARWPAAVLLTLRRWLHTQALLVCCCAPLLLALVVPSSAQTASTTHETYVLSGTVVNSTTGEPISRALVHLNGQFSRTAFSDSEGHFQFIDLPAGQVTLVGQKPGYYSDQDATGFSLHPIEVGPNTGAQVVKLLQQGAIYGRVLDAAGQPVERIAVRLTNRIVRGGRKLFEPRGMIETDEDGHFRLAGLMPGEYYLSVGPAESDHRILAEGEKPTTGYHLLYYPGVPDQSAAAPIQLTPGQQVQADFSLTPVPVFEMSGNVSGIPSDRGAGLMLFSAAGDDVMLPIRFNPELGTFKIDSVPAGSYLLRVFASGPDQQQMRADLKLNVASNLENVHLAMAPSLTIPIVVHTQARATSASQNRGVTYLDHPSTVPDENRVPINISLHPTQPNGSEIYSTLQPHGSTETRSNVVLQNVEPGSYSVNFTPQQPWYVQSASYGQTNPLTDNITVAPGQNYPLDVVLRDDSATLTANLRVKPTEPRPIFVVAVPLPATTEIPHTAQGTGSATLAGLAPGDYLVFAFDRIDSLEYGDPDALAPYASQAARITLAPNQRTDVTLDLIHTGNAE